MRKEKGEKRGKKRMLGKRVFVAAFPFASILFLLLSSFPTHAQFIGPCADPTQPTCAILVASSTRALGIATSTVYSTQSSLIFRTLGGSNQHIIFMPNGKVGIATTTPAYMLTVQGDILATGNVYGTNFVGGLSGSLSAANVSSGVFGSLQGSGNFAFPVSLGVATTTTAGLPQALSVYGGGYFTGNVGIGAANPQAKISLGSDVTAQKLLLYDSGNTRYGGGIQNNEIRFFAPNSAAHISFGSVSSADGSTWSEKVRIDTQTGDVGIGATDPGGYRLRVGGTGYFSDNLTVNGVNMVTGNLAMNGGDINGVDKLTVTTVDPLYSIGGVKYSTYGPSVAGGVFEEYVGHGKLEAKDRRQWINEEGEFEYVIDFDKEPEGTDLWVWRRVVDFSSETVSVLVTPYGEQASVFYAVRGNALVIRGDRAVPFSFRLSAKRFDWRSHPTRAADQSAAPGLIAP